MSLLTTTIIAGGVAVGAYFGGPFALVPFASNDTFVTYISPGDGKMILKGGEFHDFHISLPGSHLNRPGASYYDPSQRPWEILPNALGTTDYDYDERPDWMKKFGFFPVGIPFQRSVNEEVFEWKEESGGQIVPRRELTRKFKVNAFPYVIVQTEVISRDGLPLRLTYIVGLRIINPHKALIETEDWLVQLEAAIQQAVRNWAAGFKIMELISQTDARGSKAKLKENFELEVCKLSDEMRTRFGVAVETADLKAPMPDGPRAQAHLDSIAAPFAAKKAGEVMVIGANCQAEADEVIGMVKAKVDKAVAEAAVAGEVARYAAAEQHKEGAAAVIAGEALKGATVFAMPSGISKLVDKLGDKL